MLHARVLLAIQAAVYLTTGVWSVLSRGTFESVTGPKTDYWLVRMVGLLAIVIGATLLAAQCQTAIPPSTWILAIGSAVAFAGIDLRYALRRRISRIYLIDAAFEGLLAIALGVAWWTARSVA